MEKLPNVRLYYLDAVRAFLMLLGVPYHVARIYSVGQDNFINSTDTSSLLSLFADFSHSFRMEAFFVIAGFFACLILVRGKTDVWLKSRMVRVIVPLLFCTLLVGPLTTAAVVMADVVFGRVEAGLFWTALAGRMQLPGSWVYHLWFLHILIMLSLFLALLRIVSSNKFVAPIRDRVDMLAIRLTNISPVIGGFVLAGFALCFWLAVFVLQGPLNISLSPFGPFFRLSRFLQFMPFFLIGVLLARHPHMLQWMVTPGRSTFWIAAAAASLYATASLIPFESRALLHLYLAATTCLSGVFWTKWLFSFAFRHISTYNRVVQYFANASYSIYIFHLPIALWLGVYALKLSWRPEVEFLLILASTLLLSMLLHELVRRSPLLSLLINGVNLRKWKMPGRPLTSSAGR